MLVRFGAALARGQAQRCRHRQDHQDAETGVHHFVVALADAEGDVAELLVASLLVLPVEPVPVAPIELVPELEPGVVVLLVLAVPEPLSVAEPLVEPGVVEAVDEFVEGVVGDVLVVEDVVLDSRFVQAPSERAATTARAAAAAWVRVIFIRKLLERETRFRACEGKGSRDCPDTTLGRPAWHRVGTRSKRM